MCLARSSNLRANIGPFSDLILNRNINSSIKCDQHGADSTQQRLPTKVIVKYTETLVLQSAG